MAESETDELIGGSGVRSVSLQVDDDGYGVVADDGRPQLPRRTLLLSVQANATNFRIRMGRGCRPRDEGIAFGNLRGTLHGCRSGEPGVDVR